MTDEPIPDPLAALDQAMAEMRTLAKVLRAHHAAMVEAGFTEVQAFALTVSYEATIVAKQLGG